MFQWRKKKPVAENEVDGEIERVYHEIRQTLRVTGVNLNFRTWAAYGGVLPVLWDAIRPNAEARAFEEASDRVRASAAEAAAALGRLGVRDHVQLGESQEYQIRGALDLYHYVNPKLLVVTSCVLQALRGELTGGTTDHEGQERVARGAPEEMLPMEMEEEKPENEQLQSIFEDIKDTLKLESVNSDYRTLALWPVYLDAAWKQLKPVTQRDAYRKAADGIRQSAIVGARQLPYPVAVQRGDIEKTGESYEEVVATTEHFEHLLPGLILNIALLEHDWHAPISLARSPYPPSAPSTGGVR